ncbi:MAG: alcohol dehydrogenase catalytic domain-containing protein [Clostridiales bacterium]|nr:alcohol dehydrogenase catalytic domain-containing protein [Clostridiales bacterium]
MKSYKIYSLHTIKAEESEAQPVGENCVKLKNLICGISSADIGVYTGKIPVQFPIIPVRQCVGFVSEVGSAVTGLSRGDRVVTYPQASCHSCKSCKEGKYYDCEKPNMFGLKENGFLSDFSVVSADDVYAIPDRLKNEEAIYTEHTAMAMKVMAGLGVDKGDHLIIVGATSVGIILAQVAMYYQAVPIVVDMHEEMLGKARAAGVYYTINAVSEDVGKKILALTGGHMGDACAYFISSKMPLKNIIDYTARRGKIALVGTSNGYDLNCNLAGFIEKNLDIVTVSDCGKNYPSAINMLANHTVKVDMLNQYTISFNDVAAEFEKLGASEGDGGNEKILVKI